MSSIRTPTGPVRPEVNARQRDAPSGEFRVGNRPSLRRSRRVSLALSQAHEPLRIEDAVNDVCPWSGKPIAADSLTLYNGSVVGFCNPDCRDKFASAINAFEAALQVRRVSSAGLFQ